MSSGDTPTPAAAAQLSADELRQRAAIAKQIAGSFGDIVTLLLRSPSERKRPIEDLEWMVIPALQAGQFAVAEAQSQETGTVTPAGVVLWANVSESVDQRLARDLDQPMRLTAEEWRSGSIPWIVAAFGETKVVGGLLQQLSKTVFKGTPARIRARGPDGKPFVGRLGLSGQTPEA